MSIVKRNFNLCGRCSLWRKEHLATLELPIGGEKVNFEPQKWLPPTTGWVMVNTDGSVLLIETREEHQGNFLSAGSKLQAGVIDPFISELLVCREGLVEAAKAQGQGDAAVQIDCQQIITLWKDPRQLKFAGIHILKEHQQLGSSSESFDISFIKREANSAAHVCAKHALNTTLE